VLHAARRAGLSAPVVSCRCRPVSADDGDVVCLGSSMLDATPGRQHVVRRHAPHDAQIPAERLADGATPPIHLAVNALHTPARQRCIADIAPDTPDEPTRTPRRPNDSPTARHRDDPSRCVRSEHARMLAHAFTNFSLSLSLAFSLSTLTSRSVHPFLHGSR